MCGRHSRAVINIGAHTRVVLTARSSSGNAWGLLILDVAVSLAEVADVDRNLGNENAAVDGFQEGIKLLESLTLNSEEDGLEKRRLSVLEFLNNQVPAKQSDSTPGDHVSADMMI